MEIDDLKLELFDAISKAKNSMDIKNIKYETDTIYDRYKERDIINGEVCRPLLESDINIAIISYCYNSEISLSDRLLIIDGMIFFADIYANYEGTMQGIDMKNQVTLTLMCYDANKEELNLDSKDEHNFKKGIAIAAKINNEYKENKEK